MQVQSSSPTSFQLVLPLRNRLDYPFKTPSDNNLTFYYPFETENLHREKPGQVMIAPHMACIGLEVHDTVTSRDGKSLMFVQTRVDVVGIVSLCFFCVFVYV
jgi:hypothetical protein